MSLETGQTLGPYEITGRLGAGGIGEVYLARDTRLNRNVAVKVLPTHMSENAELRDREGQVQPLDEERRPYAQPRTAPDGRRVAVCIGDDEYDVWIYEVERGTRVRLTAGGGSNNLPIWSSDAERVFFSSNRSGASGVYARAANGSGDEELVSREGNLWPYFETADGVVGIGRVNAGTNYDFEALTPDGERFLMIQSDDGSSLRTIHVVLNFFDELERVFPSE